MSWIVRQRLRSCSTKRAPISPLGFAPDAQCSSVNVAEIIAKLIDRGRSMEDCRWTTSPASACRSTVFDEAMGIAAGQLRELTRRSRLVARRPGLPRAGNSRKCHCRHRGPRLARPGHRLQDRTDPVIAMPVIHSQISPASDTFRANAEHMRALVADISRQGGDRRARRLRRGARAASSRAASCCRASGWRSCSTPARPSSRSASSPPGSCMASDIAVGRHDRRHRPRRRHAR